MVFDSKMASTVLLVRPRTTAIRRPTLAAYQMCAHARPPCIYGIRPRTSVVSFVE